MYWGCVAEILQKEPQVFPWGFLGIQGDIGSHHDIFRCCMKYQCRQPSVSLQAEDESRVAGGARVGREGSSISRLGWMKNSGPCAFCVPWEVQQLQSDSEFLNQMLRFTLVHLGAWVLVSSFRSIVTGAQQQVCWFAFDIYISGGSHFCFPEMTAMNSSGWITLNCR